MEVYSTDNQKYWNDYYKNRKLTQRPSFFAENILKYLDKGKLLIDLGCGNGRDSIFFWQQGIQVIAIDSADIAMKQLKAQYSNSDIQFISGDFVENEIYKKYKADYFYSRFTIHAITDWQQNLLLKNVYQCLKNNGILFIEARSVLDDIYGKGEPAGRNAYIYEEHYRRFIVAGELENALESEGFTIISSEESRGFAPFEGTDPVILRMIAKKKINR